MTIRLYPGPDPVPGDADRLHLHESLRLRAAALHARRTIPGALGELVFRELIAYADFGYRFGADALIPRLADEILAISTPAEAARTLADAAPGQRSDVHRTGIVYAAPATRRRCDARNAGAVA